MTDIKHKSYGLRLLPPSWGRLFKSESNSQKLLDNDQNKDRIKKIIAIVVYQDYQSLIQIRNALRIQETSKGKREFDFEIGIFQDGLKQTDDASINAYNLTAAEALKLVDQNRLIRQETHLGQDQHLAEIEQFLFDKLNYDFVVFLDTPDFPVNYLQAFARIFDTLGHDERIGYLSLHTENKATDVLAVSSNPIGCSKKTWLKTRPLLNAYSNIHKDNPPELHQVLSELFLSRLGFKSDVLSREQLRHSLHAAFGMVDFTAPILVEYQPLNDFDYSQLRDQQLRSIIGDESFDGDAFLHRIEMRDFIISADDLIKTKQINVAVVEEVVQVQKPSPPLTPPLEADTVEFAPIADAAIVAEDIVEKQATPQPSEQPIEENIYDARLNFLKKTLSAYHNGPTTLSPQELTSQEHLPKKVLIVGHCSADNWRFHHQNLTKTPCDFLLVNNLQKLPEPSNQDLSTYDFQVINFPLRFILQDSSLWGSVSKSKQELEVLFEKSLQTLRALFQLYTEYNHHSGLLTFVTNFMVPSFNPNGKLLPYYDLNNPQYYIDCLNKEIEHLVQQQQNTYVININTITGYFGKRYIQEDLLHLISHGSFMPGNLKDEARIEHSPPLNDHYLLAFADFLNLLWVEIISAYRIVVPKQQIKLIVIDLDDTLWQGVAAEMSSLDIHITEGWPVGVLEALSYFKDRGGLIAILSKNYLPTVEKVWSEFYESRFPLKNFVAVKADFRSKVTQMRELLVELKLTAESVIFIDDNPTERAEMKLNFSSMRVLHGYHYYWRKIILLSAETQVPFITPESLNKTELMTSSIQLQQQLESSESRELFLRELDIQIDIRLLTVNDDSAFNRCLELLNKTNQFNTTGRRWKPNEFSEKLQTGQVYYFSMRDRYSNHGTVGVLVLQNTFIEQFVMSCRVIGLNVEFGVIDTLCQLLHQQNPDQHIQAALLETDLNLMCRNIYKEMGFKLTDNVWQYPDSSPLNSSYTGKFLVQG